MTRRVFLGGAAFGLMSSVALGANGLSEPFRLEKTHVRVAIRDLPVEFEGYRIGQISDLHYPRNMTADFIRSAISKVNDFHPDVIVITGDLVDKRGGRGSRTLTGIFDGYVAPDGLFGVLGNHDHWYNATAVLDDLAANTPLRIIDHTHVLLKRGKSAIALGGVGDLWTDRVDLPSTFAGVSPSIPRILLSHNPDVAEIAPASGVRVDLQLSGHTHGGEIRLPLFGPPAVPSRYGRKYERGLVQGPAWPVYVNRGLCSPRFIRFGCRPEVTCIELVSA